MASRIQGITVEIGGDTTKLSKALESVNKSIKGTQSGLKDVNKLLKLDPSNTELVVQKQKMLKDAIEATKEKLATLKTAAQQANEQLANGEITQQQYDALQREIVETEQNLRSLQDQAATTNATLAKIDEAGEKLQNIGSSVENVGKKFLPVTAAVTGLGTAAVKTAADFDSEMSKVSAISGATGDDFDQLRAKAREMGAKTKFSASEAASAMEYMAMAGWKTSDMLNGIEGVMNLAAASGEDLATTSDIVTDALTAFGLSAADSGHFADILAAASSNANTNVSMMGETFKYCAPIAGALGFSAEDTAEAIGLMANSGIKASQAGTSLRTIMNNLSGEVTFAGKNIGEVTIATSNADGSMRSLNDILADCRVAFSGLTESEKASNAEALVGKNAMSGFLALMNSSETDINKLRGAIENCDGASESMAETMQDNLNGQLTILKSQLEELAISFGDILMPTIRKIVSAVQQFVDKLNSIYADEAKSGTNREHREEFNRMIKDAMDGKLDYIVTKSISRFARNTIDSLTCTRELRQLKPPVGIYFEKENIDTLDAKGELILTILSALAQDESRSISDNIRWSIQKKFQSGVPHINLKRMLGYELGANKQWVIVPEQAEIIRYIFDRFVKGQTANKIALELNQMEKFTVNGKKWSASSILIVLRNEKYVGDIEMQKTITKDFLTHRSSINKGEAPRYYVKNHHVGIIDRVTWDKVQTMLFEKPRADMTKGPGKKKVKSIKGSPFGNLRCGAILENGPDAGKPCGEGFFRTTYTGVANGYSDERSLKATGEDTGEYLEKYTYSYPVWRCKRKVGERDGEPPKNGSPDQKAYCRSKKGCMSDEEKEAANKRCPSERYHECALEQSFMELLYSMKRDFEQHGDASMIVAMFDNAYEQAVRLANNNSISVQRMATVENQIKEMEERLQDAISHQVAALREAALEQNVELNEALSNGEVTIDDIDLDIRSGLTPGSIGVSFYGTETEEGSEAQIYTELVNDLQERLKTLQQERQTIEEEQGVLAIMKKNFEYFLACLKELPDTNAGGMPLRVNGLDVQGTLLRDVDGNAIEGRKRAITSGKLKLTPERIAEAPDMLHFEKGIYCAFVESGVLQGDVATYKTNFGVTLTSKGNRRTLDSFMGYKRSDMDGNVVYVDAPYKVYGFSIQYRRYLTTAAKREREEAV